jgi:membrane fusion protein
VGDAANPSSSDETSEGAAPTASAEVPVKPRAVVRSGPPIPPPLPGSVEAEAQNIVPSGLRGPREPFPVLWATRTPLPAGEGGGVWNEASPGAQVAPPVSSAASSTVFVVPDSVAPPASRGMPTAPPRKPRVPGAHEAVAHETAAPPPRPGDAVPPSHAIPASYGMPPRSATLPTPPRAAPRAARAAPPSTHWLRNTAMVFGATSLGVLCAMIALSPIEISARASGSLHLPNGVRPVSSLIAGSVTDVFVRPGELVQEGQPVARIEAAELGAGLVKRQRDLTTLEQDTLEAEASEREFIQRAKNALFERRAALSRRIELLSGPPTVSRACASPLAVCVLPDDGPRTDPADGIAALRGELALVDLELADRGHDWQARERERRVALSRAEAGLDDVEDLLDSVLLRSPIAGRVEAMLVAPGEAVAAGAVLAQVVPYGVPRRAQVFVPLSEIDLIAPEEEATLELSSTSDADAAQIPARVSYVRPELATAEELERELGRRPDGTFVRVELELLDAEPEGQLALQLHAGTRVVAHFPPRERQLGRVVADAAIRWFE